MTKLGVLSILAIFSLDSPSIDLSDDQENKSEVGEQKHT